MERGIAGYFFEDPVEGLVRSKSAEGDGIGDGLVIGGVLRIDENGLSMLYAVLRYVSGETETGTSVDTVGDVSAVGTDSGGEVLYGEVRVGEKSLLSQGGCDLDEQFVCLGGGSVIHDGLFLLCNRLLWKDGMGSDVTEAKEQYRHDDRRNADQKAAVETFATEDIEQGRNDGCDTYENE